MSSAENPSLPVDKANPWITLASRLVYENPWISVREDRVIRPDGAQGIYGVVQFKNRAVGVLPVDDHGRIWLVGQYRYPLQAYSWEIPEGGSPPSESLEETAGRELREETGLIAERLELVACAHLSNSVCDEVGYVFRATGLVRGSAAPEGTERLVVRRFDWQDALSMLKRGEVTDSLSVIALWQEAVLRLEALRFVGPRTIPVP
jgi:8-oxo-dGTP pyrophosphatase MutT (NUDIX family)